MSEHYALATGANKDAILLAYDSRTEDAIIELMAQLPPETATKVLDKLSDAAGEYDLAWRDIVEGRSETPEQPSMQQRPGGRRNRITPDDGENDAEHPAAGSFGKTHSIQNALTAQLDACLR
eukprot:8821767-Karenia_brevis.AAC.1